MKTRGSLWAWCALACAGCSGVGLSTGDGTGGGAGGAGTGASSSSAAGGAAGAQGIDCGADPDTGATLCLGISTCPGLLVDGDSFPGCGFRVRGATLDLECSCTGQLCPIGTATSCAGAVALMKSQESAGNVCAEVSDGRCTDANPSPAAAAAATTCSQTCYDMCAGNPTCIADCGC
jgi:hypothetical protein